MRKNIIIVIVATALVSGAGFTYKAQAAIPVIDMENIAQTVLAVSHTMTQIQNQLLELQPLDLQFLQSQINGINQQISQIKNTAQQAGGLMNQSQSVDQKWQQTFGSINTLFSSEATITADAQIARTRNTAYTLDQTYQDAYRAAKNAADIDQEWAILQSLMVANKNAVGNKQSLQVQNSLIAQQNILLIKQQQSQSTLSSVIAATAAAQNMEDAQTTAKNKKMIEQNEKLSQLGSPLANMRGGTL